MPTLADIRAQYPQYQDLSDQQLADSLYRKFYRDLPRVEFDQRMGIPPDGSVGPSLIEGIARQFANGVPVIGGALNRADAATNAALAPLLNPLFSKEDQLQGDTYVQRYENALAQQNGADASFQREHPVLSAGSQIAGAVAGSVPMVMAAPAVFGAGGGNLLARTLASGASGAALGGADSAMRSDGDPWATAKGAIGGGAAGLVGPAAGKAIGAGWQGLRDFRALNTAAKTAGMDRGVLSTLGRAARDDGMTAASIGQRMNEIGPDAMLMDLGDNLKGTAGALAASPGRAQKVIRDALTGRGSGAAARIQSAADSALGGPIDRIAAANEIIAKRSAASKPLYQAAYAQHMPFSPELKNLLQRPAMKKALSKAETLSANDENAAPKQFFARISGEDRGTGILDAAGNEVRVPESGVTFTRTPNVEELDLTKRALDDMISTAQRQGNANESRIYTQLKNSLTGMMDKAVPEYAGARNAFAGPSAVLRKDTRSSATR